MAYSELFPLGRIDFNFKHSIFYLREDSASDCLCAITTGIEPRNRTFLFLLERFGNPFPKRTFKRGLEEQEEKKTFSPNYNLETFLYHCIGSLCFIEYTDNEF